MSVDVLYSSRDLLGESPIWDEKEQVYYWGDLKNHKLYKFNPLTGQVRDWSLPYQFGCFALRNQGGMIFVTDNGFEFFDLESSQLTPVINPEENLQHEHCYNDGKVDVSGRFWVGSIPIAGARGQDVKTDTGNLYSLDSSFQVTHHRSELFVSNGMAWSPDGRKMYHVDSWIRTLYVYDFNAITGLLTDKKILKIFDEADGYPDGCCTDSNGNLWIAMWDGWKVINLDANGNKIAEVSMPVQRPTSCCFGGRNLDQLFITSASAFLTPEELEDGPMAGSVFSFNAGVIGQLSFRFKG